MGSGGAQLFEPGSREWYADKMFGTGTPMDVGQRNADARQFLAEIAPVTGEAASLRDAWDASGRGAEALSEGLWGDAAQAYGDMGVGLLGAIPIAGTVGRASKRGAAWMDRNLPDWFNQAVDIDPKEASRTTNIFAGPTAKTADKEMLQRAKDMDAAGAGRDDIWNATGWFKGPDDQWRFEISDDAVQLKDVVTDSGGLLSRSKSGTFSGIDHPELNAAYGDIPSLYGRYNPYYKEDGAFLADPTGKQPPYISAAGPNQKRAKSVALHEMQHYVQDLEGFAPGASAGTDGDAYRAYWLTPGEVEARNVQSRIDMPPDQRRAIPPWHTEDVTPFDYLSNTAQRRVLEAGSTEQAIAELKLNIAELEQLKEFTPENVTLLNTYRSDLSDLEKYRGRR